MATTVKHFPGLGRVAGNTDFTAGVVDTVTTADDPYLEPFATAIDAGVPFVMVSLATYDQIDPERTSPPSRTRSSADLLRRPAGVSRRGDLRRPWRQGRGVDAAGRLARWRSSVPAAT